MFTNRADKEMFYITEHRLAVAIVFTLELTAQWNDALVNEQTFEIGTKI